MPFNSLGTWLDTHADPIVNFLFHRRTRSLAAWFVALLLAGLVLDTAWHAFDNVNFTETENRQRRDANHGYCTIDFGGQWLMGAMLVNGHGQELYNRNVQREVLAQAYPPERQYPDALQSDADRLMSFFMGETNDDRQAPAIVGSFLLPLSTADALGTTVLLTSAHESWHEERMQRVAHRAIGGPLYPPINAFVYAPLGMLPPHVSYRLNQVLNIFWAFVAGLGVHYLTRGRIWCPIAAMLILFYPGFKGSIHLGQNASLTLAILVWGWALIARDRPIAAGLVWGLLAFKPVWAAAFFLVPLLTFRWRTCLAMLAMGTGLALATLPFVGWQAWLDWLRVGREASELYNVDRNWIFLSRDLLSIPRRFLLDFDVAGTIADVPAAAPAGWALLFTCLLLTAGMALWRRQEARAVHGAPAAFLLLGAWLCCFHFMYYDVLLTVLPIFVLLAEPAQIVEPILVAFVPLGKDTPGGDLSYYYGPGLANSEPPPLPVLQPGFRHLWVLNRFVPNLLVLLLIVEHGFHQLGLSATLSRPGWQLPLRLTTDPYTPRGQPWDTYCLIVLWLWCGLTWLRTPGRMALGVVVAVAVLSFNEWSLSWCFYLWQLLKSVP